MPQISKDNRDQLQMIAINDHVPQDSLARVIDVFIDGANLRQLGFQVKGTSKEGRPAFSPETLSKLYLYGYLHGIRSSRKLEHACNVNIELWWLLQFQKPRYKTIADFRKDNAVGFANLFNHFRDFCLSQGLYGKNTVAIDGSKFRAQNSKAKYEDLKAQLDNTDQTQISTSDPDARALPLHMRIVEVGYNLQSAVDDKHNLIVDYQVTNKNDHRALAQWPCEVKRPWD